MGRAANFNGSFLNCNPKHRSLNRSKAHPSSARASRQRATETKTPFSMVAKKSPNKKRRMNNMDNTKKMKTGVMWIVDREKQTRRITFHNLIFMICNCSQIFL